MATSNKVFVSPGVYTSERDLSFVSQSVGITTLGIAGETLKGPAFEPIFITSYGEFETLEDAKSSSPGSKAVYKVDNTKVVRTLIKIKDTE